MLDPAQPLAGPAGDLLDAFLRRAPGDPLRRLDHAADLRAGRDALNPAETALLRPATARVRGAA